MRAVELLKLLLAAAEQILDVDEALPIHGGVAAELSRDDGLYFASIFGRLGTSGSQESSVQS